MAQPPCSSHSRIAPASCSTEIAQPRSVRIADRRSFVINIETAPAGDESFRSVTRSGSYHMAAIPNCGGNFFPRVPPPCARWRLGRAH